MAIAPLLAATTAFIQRAPRMLIGAHSVSYTHLTLPTILLV